MCWHLIAFWLKYTLRIYTLIKQSDFAVTPVIAMPM